MTRHVFYSTQDGSLLGSVVDCPARLVAQNTPAGYTALAHATADPQKHRVDLATKELMPYKPPAPSTDYEWNESKWKWEVSAAAQTRRAALAQIRALEAGQHRAMRETLLGVAGGKEKLQEIDDKITGLRKLLS